MLDIKRLIADVYERLSEGRKKDESFESYLEKLLDEYQAMIQDLNPHLVTDTIKMEIASSIKIIKEVLELYSSACVAQSISKLQDYIMKSDNNLLEVTISKEQAKDLNWYRMRLQEPHAKIFPARQMFHIPFNQRGMVNTQRYSLPGYPCLYVSRSVWAAWEEMHEPKLADFCVSRLKLQADIKVLDLRMVSSEKIDQLDISHLLCTFPLIIACSIKTLNPDDNFKPEYIIPQLVMLSIVESKKYDGCAYTSTQKNLFFDNWTDIHLLDNLALPVKEVNAKKDLCEKLCSCFRVTDATNYEYELLKDSFKTIEIGVKEATMYIETENTEYDKSIFGHLENRLKCKKAYELIP